MERVQGGQLARLSRNAREKRDTGGKKFPIPSPISESWRDHLAFSTFKISGLRHRAIFTSMAFALQ
jgi:hypothetical protein